MNEAMITEVKEFFKEQTGETARVVSRIGFNLIMVETEAKETYTIKWQFPNLEEQTREFV